MGCITLLSDFGLQDASVASCKGILMQCCPQSAIVDISHLVEPFHLPQAAYLLAASYAQFPVGTCHIILCDIFSENPPQLVLAEKNEHFFIAPANGILSLALGTEFSKTSKITQQIAINSLKDWISTAGRLANEIQNGNLPALDLEPYEIHNSSLHWRPKIDGSTVECHVVHIDRFGNVIINITEDMFNKIGRNRQFSIQLIRDEKITELSSQYNDVKEGEKLCRFNTAGYLEIAINRGNAASLLGLRLHREKHLIYSTVKISFQ